jgi:hypothetical protein
MCIISNINPAVIEVFVKSGKCSMEQILSCLLKIEPCVYFKRVLSTILYYCQDLPNGTSQVIDSLHHLVQDITNNCVNSVKSQTNPTSQDKNTNQNNDAKHDNKNVAPWYTLQHVHDLLFNWKNGGHAVLVQVQEKGYKALLLYILHINESTRHDIIQRSIQGKHKTVLEWTISESNEQADLIMKHLFADNSADFACSLLHLFDKEKVAKRIIESKSEHMVKYLLEETCCK